MKKKNKFNKKSEIITYQLKTFENPNTVDLISVIREHPKASYKLSKTIKKGQKAGSISFLYSHTKKCKIF